MNTEYTEERTDCSKFVPSIFNFWWVGEGGGGVDVYEAEHFMTFSATSVGAYSRLGAFSNKNDNCSSW